MNATTAKLFIFGICLGLFNVQAAPSEVSHEDIRDAILSLVTMFRTNSEKLERHEYREKQLGEQLKKALAGLDKRYRIQDQSIEKIVLMMEKQDERLRLLENMILQKDERERGQFKNMFDTIQKVDKLLEKIVKEFAAPPRINGATYTVQETSLSETALKEQFDKFSKDFDERQEKVSNENNQFLKNLEQRLPALSNSPLGISEKQISLNLESILQVTKSMDGKIDNLPSKIEMAEAINVTNDGLHEMRNDLTATVDKGVGQILQRIKENVLGLTGQQEELIKTTGEIQQMSEELHNNVAKSYDQLLEEIKGLSNVEQVMIQTADNVMDTKRRIEYGVHQILLEVSNVVKGQSKSLNGTVNKRFDDIESTILDNQTGALANLSSKIETEISQVWRQIGIMYQQLTASATALDRLQQQTDAYVNGSVQAMDSMEGKVGMITSRMSEVDENLNFLLGRLSLVTSEFNQIKSGLATALDDIRNSFLQVQKEIKHVGPGPRPIAESESNPNNNVPINE